MYKYQKYTCTHNSVTLRHVSSFFRSSSQCVTPNKQIQNADESLYRFKFEALKICRLREVRISCVCRTGPYNVDIRALQNYKCSYRDTNIYRAIMLIRTSWYPQFLKTKNFNVFNKFFIYTCLMQKSERTIWRRSKHVAVLLNYMWKRIWNIFAFVGDNY
jgi:hypothetical protein